MGRGIIDFKPLFSIIDGEALTRWRWALVSNPSLNESSLQWYSGLDNPRGKGDSCVGYSFDREPCLITSEPSTIELIAHSYSLVCARFMPDNEFYIAVASSVGAQSKTSQIMQTT